MTEIILMADPRVTSVPVEECGEPLLDVALLGAPGLRVDDRLADPDGDWRQVRSALADRLPHAARLLPVDVELMYIEGYRSPSLQAEYFSTYLAAVTRDHPGLDGDQLHRLASRYISPPEVAPHSAGAAVDVTLCDPDGRELDMGTEYDATPEASRGACYTDAVVSAAARRNRGCSSTR